MSVPLHRFLPRVLLLLLLAMVGAAARAEGPSRPLWLTEATPERVRLVEHLDLLEDPSKSLTLDDVRRAAAHWTSTTTDSINPGFSRSAWWLRLRVENRSASARSLVLDLHQPLQDFVDWHVLRTDGSRVLQARSGDRVPFGERPVAYPGLALPLELAAGEAVDIYLRLDTHDGLFEAMQPALEGRAAFRARLDSSTLLQGLYFGVLLALAVYNLFLAWSLRERAFALYVAYLGSFLLWSFTARGLALQYLWPASPAFNNQALAFGAAMSFACITLFSVEYLRLRERDAPWVWRTFQALAAMELVAAPFAFVDHYALFWAVVLPVGLATMVLTGVAAERQRRRGWREGLFFCGAFVPLGIGLSLHIATLVSVLPASTWSEGIWQLSAVFEVGVLAIGLADSMHRIKAQKLAAEQRARLAQEALTSQLEGQVRERTQALERANRRLQTLAISDELTGAYNRRHFNDVCRSMLAQPARDQALLLCMFDIDHFKLYNDRYGHQAGDRALAAVAGAVHAQLRRSSDFLFRLGGEEFGVLTTAENSDTALAFAHRLRLAVRSLGIEHAGHAAGVVTASFGVVTWPAHELGTLAADAMYLQCDQQLYAAKAAGRDCVAFLDAAAPSRPSAGPSGDDAVQ